MARAQAALEYLIIVVIAITIIAILAYLIIGYSGTQRDQYYYNTCRNSASICAATIAVDPSDPCHVCDYACNYSDGTEIFEKAINCCKLGDMYKIFPESGGCDLPTPPQVCLTDGTVADHCSVNTPGRYCLWDLATGTGTLEYKCSICGCAEGLGCNYLNEKCGTINFESDPVTDDFVNAYSVAIGDADNDLDNEVVIGIRQDTDNVRVYDYDGTKWVKTVVRNQAPKVNAVAIADADNDGSNELVIGTDLSAANPELGFYTYDQTGNKWDWTAIYDVGATIMSMTVGDIDNVAGNEIAIGTRANPAEEVRVYNLTSTGWKQTGISSENTIQVNSIAVGDADNDGRRELVTGTWANSEYAIKMFKYAGATNTWIKTNVYNLDEIESVAIGDANNDGSNEIVVGAFVDNYQFRMYNLTAGIWAETNISTIGFGEVGNAVAVGDADNDGKNEVITGSYHTGNIAIMQDYNPIRKQWIENIIEGTQGSVNSIAIGNVDDDPENEIVIGFSSAQSKVYNSDWTYPS